jgi:DNA-directed RNA polymerase II subunit RPB4
MDENSSTLTFPQDFQDIQCLLISEVRVLLELARNKKVNLSEYCDKFSKFNTKDSVKQARLLLKDYHQFEMAQLTNLCPETVEEALMLIPSLATRNEDELQTNLNDLQTLLKYQ